MTIEQPRADRSVGAACVAGAFVAVAGLGVGYLWTLVAPRFGVVKIATGFVYADAEPEQVIGADGWFAIIGLAAGVLVAVGAWILLKRYRGTAMLVGIVLGSLVGAALAWWVGTAISAAEFAAVRDSIAIGTRVDAPLGLRLTGLDKHDLWPPRPSGVAAVQALAAAFAYTMLAGFSAYPSLRGPDSAPAWLHEQSLLSSDRVEPEAPTH